MTRPVLLYLYGPPAVGKLTIASVVSERTGLPLWHNHLTVNALRPVLPFGSPGFVAVLHRLRLDVFETAIGAGTGLVFTNNAAWGVGGRPRFEAWASKVVERVSGAGGEVAFVQLTADRSVLEARVGSPSRIEHGKLLDPARLHELLDAYDPSPLHDDDLIIDTGRCQPEAAAALVAERVSARS